MAGAAPLIPKTTYAVAEKKRTYARGFSTVFGKGLHDESVLDKFRPVTIVVIMSFDKPLDAEMLRTLVLERLVKRWERFRSRMAVHHSHVVFEELAPEELDLNYHVTVEKSQGWDASDWDQFLLRIYSSVKDVERPLWRWHICNDLKSGQSRIVWNLDHCLCDGVSVAYCINQLFDPDESAPHIPPSVVKRAGNRPNSVFKIPKPGLLDKAWWALGGVAEGLLGTVLPGDSMSSMKMKNIQAPSKEKRFSNAKTICLAEIGEIKNKLGVTINDVLGGLLNMTVQRYLRETEPEKMTDGRSIRINFPMNMRSPESMMHPEIRNEISTGMIKVALNHRSTFEAVMEHHWLMLRIKNSPASRIQMHLLNVLAKILPYDLLVQIAFVLFGKFTLMMSNVPGPPKSRPFGGNTCTDVHFFLFVPIGLYCGIISYNERLSFTVSSDAQTETRPELITQIWSEEFDKLHKQVMAPDFKASWTPPRTSMLTQVVVGASCVGVVALILSRRR